VPPGAVWIFAIGADPLSVFFSFAHPAARRIVEARSVMVWRRRMMDDPRMG
jgi:hypothetical protein